MQVEDALSRLFPAVGHHAEVGDALLLGDLADDLEAVGHHGRVFRGDGAAGLDVGLGDHQKVRGGLGVDVIAGIGLVILIAGLGGDLSPRGRAE